MNCPACGAPQVVRTNHKNGNKFYGCSTYPKCTYTKSIPDYNLYGLPYYPDDFDDDWDNIDDYFGSGGDYDPGGDYD